MAGHDDPSRGTRPRTGIRARLPRWFPPVGSVLLALVAYVPLLLSSPGVVGADTKTYLYLDPARLLGRAPWMWDTHIGLGTVTHQNIGYLWPMGPWYWFFETLGVPDWVAQRLWLGTVIFAAGMGVRFMLRELRWVGPGVTVASFAYALSPYLLHYGARISVILLPFAGLPWLIGLTSRSVHRGGWRWPALFALVTLTVGGVNATSLLLVMAGPLLWMVHAVWVSHEAEFRGVLAAGLRISALTFATSLWWIAGLAVQGAYGIPILRYTETYHTVANAALSTELLRGLGYWFFYGRDALGAWIQAAERMTQQIPALVLSFTLPGIALVSGFLTRFRNRGYFALLVATGLLIGVGTHPWDAPSPAGALFKAWTTTDSGLAFRSTPRAVPLIALGLAVMLAAGVAAVASRWGAQRPRAQTVVAGVLLAMIMANQWALFGGEYVDRNLQRDEELPGYWLEAAEAMDAGGTDTRVYELPGTDFASYRWGNTVDPITPGLIDRPYAARELIPYGTPPSADLLNAWDLPLQEGRFDPGTLAPVARLLGIGTIAHRGDLQFERFRTPRPDTTYQYLLAATGLEQVGAFGEDVANLTTPGLRLDDEVALGVPPEVTPAPAVSLFEVADARPITRTVDAAQPTLLAGDGAGVVAWAAVDGLDPDSPLLYAASFAEDPDGLLAEAGREGAQLVVTDTNRRQARRWGSVRENDGYTEREGEEPLEDDPSDNRLEKFPGADDSSYTVSEQVGGATLSASAYGNPVSYTPSDRAARAMDGDPDTAWRVGAFDEPRGEYLVVQLDEPVTTDHLEILQSQRPGNRWLTEVELSFDGSDPVTVALDDSSRAGPPGQRVEFAERTFAELRITVTETNIGRLDRYQGVSDVGIAELSIPGVGPVTEYVRPPVDLLDALGEDSLDQPLTWVFTRRAANPSEVVVSDEEQVIRRRVDNPVERTYTLYGRATASTLLSDTAVDDLLGVGGTRAVADVRLAGDLRSRATSAVDGDPSTAWQTPVNSPTGHTLEVTLPEPTDLEGLNLQVRRDGLHSVPTRVSVAVDGGEYTTFDLEDIGVGSREDVGATADLVVPFDATGVSQLQLRIDEVAEANSIDWFGGSVTALPVGIAELGLPVGAEVPADTAPLRTGCREDLLEVDGAAVPLRLEATVGEVLDGTPVSFSGCSTVELPAGSSTVATTPGRLTGFDVDRLAFASGPGGVAGRDTLAEGPVAVAPGPDTVVEQTGDLNWSVRVEEAQDPYWVVLGQSFSPGFTATLHPGGNGEPVELPEPTLINGYANGWLIDADLAGPDARIEIAFAPQRMVWIALGASAVGVLVCIAVVLWPSPRRRRRTGTVERAPLDAAGTDRTAVDVAPSVGAPVAPVHVSVVGPFEVESAALPLGPALLGAALGALGTWLLAGIAAGLVVGATTLVALAFRRGRVVLRLVGIGLFAAAAGFVIAKQWRGGYLLDFNWMNLYEVTHAWTLAAVALLVMDPVVGHLRRARGPGRPD